MEYYRVKGFESRMRDATCSFCLYLFAAASLALAGIDMVTPEPMVSVTFFSLSFMVACGAIAGLIVDVRHAAYLYHNNDFDRIEVIFSAVVATDEGFQLYYVATKHHSGRHYNGVISSTMRLRFHQWMCANDLTYVRATNEDDHYFLETRL